MKGFRTLGFNLVGAVLPVLQAADLTQVLDARGMAIYGVIMAVLNIGLRVLTNTPVTKKF